MTDDAPLMYDDEHGGLLPSIPQPGARVRILWRADDEDMPQHWAGAYYLGENTAGFWWTPDDDRDDAMWTPWSEIRAIAGGLP